MQSITPVPCKAAAPPTFEGGRMDIAMAMGLALFGMFTASTVVFFYKFAR